MRLFELQRDVDVSGASGTGRVAQGVVVGVAGAAAVAVVATRK